MKNKIVLVGEFTDLNRYINAERSNRFMGAKIKKTNGDNALKQLICTPWKGEYPVRVSFLWVTKNERIDPDNTAFAKKFLLDAIVTKGILKDDTRKCIKGFVDNYAVDAENPRVEITIES